MIWLTAGLWATLWGDNPATGKLIILIIVALAIISLFKGRLGFAALKNESGWIRRAETALDDQIARRAEEDPPGPLNLDELLEEEGDDSLVQRRIKVLRDLHLRRVKISVQQLQDLASRTLETREGMSGPGRAAQTSMMLGIIGTFIGLAAMVQDIQFALPSADAPNLTSWMDGFENVAAVMGGIKTAFTTSLFGMAAALVLTWVGHRLDDEKAKVLWRLEQFTATKLIPELRPDLEGATLLEDLSRRMEDAYDSLEAASEQNSRFLDRLSGIHDAYLDLVKQLREFGRSEASQDFDQLMEDVAKTNQSVLKVVEVLPQVVESFERNQRRLRDSLSPLHHLGLGFSRLSSMELPFGLNGMAVVIFLLVLTAALAAYTLL